MAFKIDFEKTERGFLRGEFTDRYGKECSIQQSSIATEDCIWLGCDHETFDDQGRACGARMHLTPEMAQTLSVILARFAKTGELEPPP